MISFKQITPKDFNKSYNPKIPKADEIKSFKKEVDIFLSKAQSQKEEEFQKNEINKFLAKVYNYDCNTKGKVDSAIYVEDKAQVLIEVKSLNNNLEFPKSQDNPLSKALYESILYFLREHEGENNNSIKHIILCNPCEFYIFKADAFRIFLKDKEIENFYKNCDKNKGVDTSTNTFYKGLESYLKTNFDKTLEYTYFRLDSNLSEEALSAIYTLLSPQVLLDQKNIIDANTLNKGFYEELLYILGLQEVSENGKSGGKILITPSTTKNTLSDAIRQTYPKLDDEAIFTLITTWNNRLLFLRLLESMLLSCNHIQKPFLSTQKIANFSHLSRLFFGVLAKKQENRNEEDIKLFGSIPYLNSSLFDRIPLEYEGKEIGLLASNQLTIFPRSILKKDERFKNKDSLFLLDYLFEFLHAYDFTTTAKDIQDDTKQNYDLLINSAVLGLVFEKLNGYKEGSFYTPSFITSYMCKESITQAVIEKFNSTFGWECDTLEELQDEMLAKGYAKNKESYLATLLSIRICDPAVGSGHFLVSALNEMIKICYDLRLIKSLTESSLSLDNDEILIYTQGKIHQYIKPTSQQQQTHQIQVELFHLKKSIIENCLFGVDINPNSCEITKLRLWIELLKYSYYLFDDQGENTNALETLPNIDINIKCGNSLISYFDLKQSLTHYPNIKSRIQNYKQMVSDYKKGLFDDKTKLSTQIQELFSAFKSFCFKDKFAKEIKAFQNKCDTYRKLYGNYLAKDDKELSLFITQNPFPKYDLTFEGDEKILQEANQSFLEIRKTYDSLYNLSSNNPFEWRFAFPEVLDSEGNFLGFDCVIGNPPYIRIQGLDRATSKQYQKTFSTASQNYDIYVLFVEQCVKLLAPKAKIAFIMPHKWLNSLFGVGLRELAKDKISKIISFGHYQIFDASTYTALQWFEKESREVKFIQAPQEIESSQEMSEFLTQLTPSDFFIFPTNSLSSSPWYFGGDLSQNLFSKVTSHTPLKEIFSKMFQGIATSKDSVYFLYDCQEGETTTKGYSQELECNVEIENDLLKPLLMGDSFHRYDTPSTELRVLFPYYQGEDSKGNAKMYLYDESTLKERFPKGYTYLKKCEKVLRARENGRLQDDDMWWRYIYPKNQLLFDKEKLLIPYACRKSQFILDTQGRFYINTKIHGLIRNESFENLDYRFLLAVLNSELNWWYMTQVASVMRGGYYTYTPAYMQDFSIPNLSPKEQKPFIKLVDQILKAKEQNPKANTQDLEKEIDSLVYTLYNLTEDEIKIIENRGWL